MRATELLFVYGQSKIVGPFGRSTDSEVFLVSPDDMPAEVVEFFGGELTCVVDVLRTNDPNIDTETKNFVDVLLVSRPTAEPTVSAV